MNRSFSRRRPAAFTLIELLTVIAIIGILAAILIPVVGKVRRSANQSRSLSNLRQIGAATRLFAEENKERLPVWRNVTLNLYWWQQLLPYAGGSKDVFIDPGHREADPTTDDTLHQNLSYGWNYAVTGRHVGEAGRGDHFITLSQVKNQSRTLMAATSAATESYGFISVDEGSPIFSKAPDPKRYDGRAPSVFLDGHVSSLPVAEFDREDPWFIKIKPLD